MAESSNAHAGDEQGGWPSEIFEPGEEAKAEGLELTCAVCCLVMREPTLLGCSNDHALCRTCAERLAREAGHPFEHEDMSSRAQLKCPIDREVVDRERFRSAPFVSRRVNELRVHCRFQGRGCEWRGDLGAFVAHTERCPAVWGVCGCCETRVLLDELPAHEAACRRPCPNADLGCTARLSRSELEAHLGRCLRELVGGRNELVARLKRQKSALEQRVEDLRWQLDAARSTRRVLVTLSRPPAPVDIEPGKKLWTGWISYPTHTPVGAVRVSAYAAHGACGHWVDELRLADSCLLSGTAPPDTLRIDGCTAFDKVATWLGGFSSTTAKLKAAVYLEPDAGTDADAADPIEAERRQALGVTSCTDEDNRQRYQALLEKMMQDRKACVVDRQYSIDLARLAEKGVPVFIPDKDKGRVSFFTGFVVYLVPPGPEASRVGAAMLQKDEQMDGPPSSEILSEILKVAEGRILAFVVSALELRPKRL
eukprot:tig00001222_g7604.t1